MKNLELFKADLKALIQLGAKLELALLVKTHGSYEVAKALKAKGAEEDFLKKLPSFNVSYEAWYSECLPLIKQTLPDRLQDFRDHFEVPKNRKNITYATYRIQDALKGIRVTRPPYDEVIVDSSAAVPHFQQQCAILMAVEQRFKSSLFDIRQLVQADLFDSEIEAARELHRHKFLPSS